MENQIVHHTCTRPGENHEAALRQRVIQPPLQLTWERFVYRRQIGKLVQAQNPGPLLQREDFEELGPSLGDDLGFKTPANILEHLLNLKIAGSFDGLAVKARMLLEPLSKQPCFSNPPPAINHQQSAALRRHVQLAQVGLAIDKIELHPDSLAPALMPVKHYVCET